jgi:hypothetical protein
MDKQCVEWAKEISAVADELPIISENIYSLVQPDSLAMTAPENLKNLAFKLKATVSAIHAVVVNQKLPAIEQDILTKTRDLFEQEVSDLRPENRNEGGRDRKYIQGQLEELFKNNSPEKWEQIPKEKTPYIPILIDQMLTRRKLSRNAKLTLRRAKLDTTFDEEGLAEHIISPCVETHLEGLADPLRTQIAETIEIERGPRYYAIHAVHKWLNVDTEEDNDNHDDQDDADENDDDDNDDEQEDVDNDDDDDDNQEKNYKITRASKRRRIAKKHNDEK